VKNEEKNILEWLSSVEKQHRWLDEIIIVDGGSTDKTVELIKEFQKNTKLNIKLIVKPGINIAQGRNIAIREATHPIIVSTDAGCKLDPSWVENIIEPFKKDLTIDVVSGVYLPWYETEFEEIASYLIFPDIEKLDPDKFLPSGRSVAFRKKAWEKVGGYPEWLDTAEDTLFDLNLKKAGVRFFLARNAIVYWKVRENVKKIFKQYYNYAKGDGVAFLFFQRYLPRYAIAALTSILVATLWYNMFFWLTATLVFFFGLYIKHIKKVKKPSIKRLFIAIIIALAIEAGIFIGYLKGVSKRIKNTLSSLIAVKNINSPQNSK